MLITPNLARAAVIHVNTNVQCGGGSAPEPVNCSGYPAAEFFCNDTGQSCTADADCTSGTCNKSCTLGQAIIAANNDADFGGCTGAQVVGAYDPIGDTIVLDAAGPYDFFEFDNTSPNEGPNALPLTNSFIFLDAKGNTLEGIAGSCFGLRDGGGFKTGGFLPVDTVGGDFLLTCDFFRAFQDNGSLSVNNATIQKFDPGCAPDYCGDNIVQSSQDEQCDDGSSNGTAGDPCDSKCHLVTQPTSQVCGDKVVNPGEQCDDGGRCASDNAPCTSDASCTATISGACDVSNSQCVADRSVFCSTDADCDNHCTARSGECSSSFNACASDSDCDTGKGETCILDGCDSNCQIEPGYACQVFGTGSSNCSSGCGDGSVNGDEECDDGGACVGSSTTTLNGTHCTADTQCGDGACKPRNGSCSRDPLTACSSDSDCSSGGACILDGCTSTCQWESYGRCFDGGAILAGSGFDSKSSNSDGGPVVLEIHSSTLKNNATMTNDVFLTGFPGTNGMSPGIGGAVMAGTLGTTVITDTTFLDNASTTGGAIIALANQMSIQNSTFNGNKVVMDNGGNEGKGSGGLSGVGGAIAAAVSDIRVNKSSFWDNHAGNLAFCDTGDLCKSGGDCSDTCDTGKSQCIGNAFTHCTSDADCQHCTADTSFGQFGGAIMSVCSPFQVNNTSIFENDSQLGGGIMSVYGVSDCSLIFGGGIKLGTCSGSATVCVGGPFNGRTCNPNSENSCGIIGQGGGNCENLNGQGCSSNSDCGNGICSPDPNPGTVLLFDRLNNSKMAIGSSTITANTASEEGGGYHSVLDDPSRVLLQGSILGGNTLTPGGSTSGPDCQGALTSNDNNLISSLEGCVFATKGGDIVAAPDLDACNSGSTNPASTTQAGHQFCPPKPTSAGHPYSPVLNTGPVKPNDPSDDQIGTLRYPGSDTHSDMGAIELNGSICGDGVIERGESCDNGGMCDNSSPVSLQGTACTADFQCGGGRCIPVTGTCSGHPATICTTDAFCSSNFSDSETCIPDGCSNSCHLQSCGNGLPDPGEECDDGVNNGTAADACTAQCRNATCGDGIRNNGEACDDGNSDDTDLCRNNCTVPSCGDGFFSPHAGEECDTSDVGVGPGHTPVLPAGTSCIACKIISTGGGSSGVCGDGIQQPGEQCDEGSVCSISGADCTESHLCGETGGTCGPKNDDGCTNHCQLPRCGDGIKQSNEQCDDGNLNNSDDCTNDCLLNVCGDGFRHTTSLRERFIPEECDDGNNLNDDSCTNACKFAKCGDGIVALEGGEECDPGDAASIPPGWTCSTDSCQLIPPGGGTPTPTPVCGDGIVNGSDECDIGSGAADTCASGKACVAPGDTNECTCQPTSTPPPPPPPPGCGDGVCDDTLTDGCPAENAETCPQDCPEKCGDCACTVSEQGSDPNAPNYCPNECTTTTSSGGTNCHPVKVYISTFPPNANFIDVEKAVDAKFGAGSTLKCVEVSGGAGSDSGNVDNPASCSLTPTRSWAPSQTTTVDALTLMAAALIPLGSIRLVRRKARK